VKIALPAIEAEVRVCRLCLGAFMLYYYILSKKMESLKEAFKK